MVDIHLVYDGHVELVENETLSNVPGQIGMANHVRHGTRTPPFIGRGKALPTPDGECWNELHVECGSVIVIDQDDDIGLLVFLPSLSPFVALEDRAEIVVVRFTLVDCNPKQGNMARSDPRSDTRHSNYPP